MIKNGGRINSNMHLIECVKLFNNQQRGAIRMDVEKTVLRAEIVREMARKSRDTDEGDPLSLTAWIIAHNIGKPTELVLPEMLKMMEEGLVNRPFGNLPNFFCLTEAGMPKLPKVAV